MPEILLFDAEVQLKKFPGKGGWTYAPLPGLELKTSKRFNYKKIKGSIDQYQIKESHLMPMGNGKHFIAVKAEIRKIINKQEGDWVKLKIFTEAPPEQVTYDEFLLCLEDAPEALQYFSSISPKEQEKYASWVLAAHTDEAKIERIALAIKLLSNNQLLKL